MRSNNFDLLRLVFAVTVLLVHLFALTANAQFAIFPEYLNSAIAVQGFFIISGFLIFMSYEKSSSLRSYFLKRVNRIYPAYVNVILLCALLGVFITSLPISQYFGKQWLHYIIANLTLLNFLQPNLPGVFENNPLKFVDGALWTIKIEVLFYLSIPLLAYLLRRFNKAILLAGLYLLSFGWMQLFNLLALKTGKGFYTELARQLPGQLAFFITGIACYIYFTNFKRHAHWIAIVAIAVLILEKFVSMPILFPLALGALVIYIANCFYYLGNFGKFGDLSYGVYIYHVPIVQLFVYLQLFQQHPWLAFMGCIASVLLAALFSWHLIEKRFLHRQSHYKLATEENNYEGQLAIK